VKWAILVSRSTTTNIEFLALTVGRSVMKSIAIDPQGRLGINRGYRSPNGRCLGALDRAHVSQDDALPTPWRTQMWVQMKDSGRGRSRDAVPSSQHLEG
jgi:hypothetical protein